MTENSASAIAIHVIENGRVIGEGDEWLESLEIEVEFEARERGLSNSDEIATQAVAIYRLKTHGGPRPGAGRKRFNEHALMVKVAISLPEAYAEAIRQHGQGNLSAGVRRLWEGHQG